MVILHESSDAIQDAALLQQWNAFLEAGKPAYGDEMDMFITWLCDHGYYMPQNWSDNVWIAPVEEMCGDGEDEEDEEDGGGE